MRNFLIPVDQTYVVERANVGRESSVNAQDLLINECSRALDVAEGRPLELRGPHERAPLTFAQRPREIDRADDAISYV